MKDTHFRGTISVSSKGVGYFSVTENEEAVGAKDAKGHLLQDDIEIQPELLHGALHDDEVEIKLTNKKPPMNGFSKRAPRPQGEVMKIIKRAKTEFVGTIEHEKGHYFLIPDDRRMYKDIRLIDVKESAHGKLTNGTKAFVKMTAWPEGKNPEGRLIKVIGKKGENNAEMESIVLEKGFETGFPAEVEREAEHIAKTEIPIPADEITRRRDFRKTLTMTIDPVDAKDFDDAISFKKLGKDAAGKELYEIGVHIADVSHYVREKSQLDKEASKRGCSIYLVDRTIPMLPEILSNGICSLNPNEDRLTFSAVFEMNEDGEISKRWFGRTIIHSHKRFTYEKAQESLNTRGEYFDELNILNTIAKKMAAKKFANGAIDFEKDEVKFELDSTGRPIRVYKKERMDTHKLVEEYMLLANREVAEFIYREDMTKKQRGGAFIYRIHDVPDAEKVTDLSIFVRALGYDLESHDGKVNSLSIRKLLNEIAGSPQEELIKTATIRSMAKAIYSTQNIGHFGLGFKYYTHFTSPIRRYPDLLVQRALFRYLGGKKMGEHEGALYEKMASRSTEREILAAEAERASIKYKQVEFMQDKVGQTFEGTITGVTEWGIYVEEKETKCEGMIKIRDIGDDFYVLDQKNYALVGEKSKRKFSLGDKIRFKVMGADLDRKALDYALA